MQDIKNGNINRRSIELCNYRKKALEHFYEGSADFMELKFADLYMYINKICIERNIHSFYNDLYSIVSRSKYDEKIVLHPQQVECLNLLENGNNILISAPTSFGKTYVALEYICRKEFKNVVFVVPTLALMTELSKKIYKNFNKKYKIITDSKQQKGDNNIFVIVPERVDYKFINEIDNVDLLVFDEIYKLNKASNIYEDKRLIPMNSCYFELVLIAKQVLLLGPFIKDVTFDRSILKENIINYYSDYNPVLIEHSLIHGDKKAFILNRIRDSLRTIVYFSSPNKIYSFCQDILECLDDIKDDKLADWCDKNIYQGWIPSSMLRKDVCIHFASLPSFFKKYVEYQYNNEMYHNVLCTSTLLEGINTPTEELIIYDDEDMQSPFKFNNLIGRVGRLDTYKRGHVYYFDSAFDSMFLNDNKYISLEIVAESTEALSIEDAIFLGKSHDNLNDSDKELLSKVNEILEKQKICIESFKSNPTINIQNFINFYMTIDEFFELIKSYMQIKDDYKKQLPIKLKIIAKMIELIPIKNRFKIIEFNNKIVEYNKNTEDKLKNIRVEVLISQLLDKKTSIYKKINRIVLPYVGKIDNPNLSTFVEMLFYLAFTYIKYDLAQIVVFYELIFNEEYVNTMDSDKKMMLDEFYNEFISRIKNRNYDDDPLSKLLDEIGIPGTDIKNIKNIIVNDCNEDYSFSSVINALRKNLLKIKNKSSIDELTKDMIEIWA